MNTKTAKALRKFLRYHPSLLRKYERGDRKGNASTITLHSSDPRYIYQTEKKEFR